MAITPKNGAFAVAFMFRGQRVYCGGFVSEASAQLWELQAREDIRKGLDVTYPETKTTAATTQDKETVSKWLDKTYRVFWADRSDPEKALQKMRVIGEFFGRDTNIRDLNTEWIDDFISHLKSLNNSGATINRKLATLSKTLNYADECIGLTRKPKIHRQKESQGRVRYLLEDEEKLVLNTAEHFGLKEMQDCIPVFLDTGVRRSELLNITGLDVFESEQASSNMLHVWVNKADLPRSVPVTKRAMEILKRRAKHKPKDAKLFDMTPKTLERQWNRIRWHLELKDVTPHIFRHTTASRLVQRGVPLVTVKQFMGHKSIQTTLRYSHLCPKNLSDAVAVLE